MNNNSIIKILSKICPGRLADESTETARLHRNKMSALGCTRCKSNNAGYFRPEIASTKFSRQGNARPGKTLAS